MLRRFLGMRSAGEIIDDKSQTLLDISVCLEGLAEDNPEIGKKLSRTAELVSKASLILQGLISDEEYELEEDDEEDEDEE